MARLALYFVLTCLLELIALNVIECAWWDQNSDKARIFTSDRPAKIEIYPYVVSIVLLEPEERFLCAGIHSPYGYHGAVVITAGSCVNYLIKNRVATEHVVVRTNSEYWNCNCGITVQYNVRKWIIHPEYQEHVMPFIGAYSVNDIGMLALDGEWEGYYNYNASGDFKPNFEVAYINRGNPRKFSIVGWGYTESSKKVQSELRELSFGYDYIKSYIKCKTRYKMDYLPENTFCLVPFADMGPCAYDQGGPLVFTNETSMNLGYGPRIVNIYGIISTSTGCSNGLTPVIIVNTSNYLDFMSNLSWVVQDRKNRWKFEHYGRNKWTSYSHNDLGWFRPGGF